MWLGGDGGQLNDTASSRAGPRPAHEWGKGVLLLLSIYIVANFVLEFSLVLIVSEEHWHGVREHLDSLHVVVVSQHEWGEPSSVHVRHQDGGDCPSSVYWGAVGARASKEGVRGGGARREWFESRA